MSRGSFKARRPSRDQERWKVQAVLQMIGERVEGVLDLVLVGGPARFPAQRGQKGLSERVACKEPVQIASGDPPIGTGATIRAAGQAQHRPCETWPRGLPEVHLVADDRHSGRELDTRDLTEVFGAGKNGVDFEEREPRHRLILSFHAERVGDSAAEYLKAAAEPEDLPTLATMGEEIDVPSLVSQKLEIADRRLRAGKDNEHGIARQRLASWHEDQLDTWLGAQRVEIVEISD